MLALAAEQFDVFITVDRNLAFQQNLGASKVAVIILRAKSNRLSDLKPLVPALIVAIEAVKPGAVQSIGSV